jgi:two-component system, cell cycle sensor histidine kinase and response regulator CckA
MAEGVGKVRVTGQLDLFGVTRAIQALSGELERDRLLAGLLRIGVQATGAERGVLLLRRAGHLEVVAEATSEEQVAIAEPVPLKSRTDLPRSLIVAAARSRENLVLDDAAMAGPCVADPAVALRQLRSVLCLAIKIDARVTGVAYFENNRSSAVFGPKQLEVLEILADQARIELHNARIHAERDRNLEALRQSEEKYRTLVEDLIDVVFSMDTGGRFTYVSPAMERLSDYSSAEVIGKPYWELVVPQDRERVNEAFQRALGGSTIPLEFQGIKKGGRIVHVRVSPRRVLHNGQLVGFNGILTDVTERHQLEEQLVQAVKLESIGRLAGGVAHDFNNLLTAILGNAELAMLDLPAESPARDAITEIVKAGQRAATLTRQLLAFASKQIVAPVLLNLSTVVGDSERMLRRLLGEDIEITTYLDPKLWAIEADPGQMEQLIVNLTVNARDAMPKGGRLTIETRNAVVGQTSPGSSSDVPPGRYVALTVTDTGSGMSSEVLSHIFEPFYTTKEPGQGTGLGLATCHGIVRQNRGHIFVFSELELGSTFRVLLPFSGADATSRLDESDSPRSIDGDEAILVVEDEEPVRRLAVLGLRAHGYTVIEAADGAAALDLVRQPDIAIDLVITDVVMPGMSGPDLSRELVRLRPGIGVILASGHPAKMIPPDLAGSSVTFVQKPYTPEQLARHVREILDRSLA